MNTQDDAILTDEEAFAKYNEYKTEFMRQECEHYFQSHKNDEWFVHLLFILMFKYEKVSSKVPSISM